ncbi:3-dehydroquinate dehydratase [Candidatus Kryptonium thompsonii]|uniref:3-dehydroquinate dehydratase n=1 Tax=Candidatus Kryptonium thompsonii TaxID=1633631 RepID=A0A0P1LYF2_9BACT|nr:type II 3-dehydroquinate dehydratase [Candidatus Kryptonium thompsoni]CUS77631.1 3-dehydroquinate dehydratase [Candidatus Kryptonium thompsoni]CUS81647.1 3-dehydroquinate dehydratase [Candidatus Kryptonium thompsoni]CUS87066.1 3-dehydroquinate dehydratase [Candidatus Kryptonium thompsoni]CUS90237.1 3-dehydroquinate dehydratase [Candidatus Kryptonium thompsoni]CUS90844.1 3-dehydroquinate dehydratase [Candidatus Kryptonium thompsoni]
MKILIIHGANLGILGKREPEIYGTLTLDEINGILMSEFPNVEFEFFNSNFEGEIVNKLNSLIDSDFDGVVINPGAFTHYSYAIRDAISALKIPVVEVHLSNIYARAQSGETFRQISVIAPVCKGYIAGFGHLSYILGVEAILKLIEKQKAK